MEKINIAELLKNCPKGMELYSPIFGIVYFQEVRNTGRAELIIVTTSCNSTYEFYNDGKFNTHYSDSEMLLFPSKEQRDWREFQMQLKKNKFDITTLKPFDKVLVRDSDKDMWCASIFSHTWKDKYFCVGAWHNQCIPYEENKELLGTTDDCDDFYKIW